MAAPVAIRATSSLKSLFMMITVSPFMGSRIVSVVIVCVIVGIIRIVLIEGVIGVGKIWVVWIVVVKVFVFVRWWIKIFALRIWTR